METVKRLEYIGSKYKLLDWISSSIKKQTGYSSFEDKIIGDLFSGSGIVSYYFRDSKAKVISNDVELYSYVISYAMNISCYTDNCKIIIEDFNKSIEREYYNHTPAGFMTINYSPYGEEKRGFFTEDNARIIDFLSIKLDELKDSLTKEEYMFILASIIVSSDQVSNTAAVYGSFLKNFKKKALKKIQLSPIHVLNTKPLEGSGCYNFDILNEKFINMFSYDIVYLDPPYNKRQYSKNYFPLNMIVESQNTLKGKTGIPENCFLSNFSKKKEIVGDAFEILIKNLRSKWIFLSYNSESTLPREQILSIMRNYGKVSLLERDYKRFKSYDYNDDKPIKEYLFCLCKSI